MANGRLREAFALFDRDGDGEVSNSEAMLVIRSCGIMLTNQEAADLPAIVAWPEFEKYVSKKLSSCNPEADMTKAFKAFDRNGDGTLSSDELGQVMKTLGEMLTDDEVENLIHTADPTNSGKINYAELVRKLLA